jgi:hypothetical protein
MSDTKFTKGPWHVVNGSMVRSLKDSIAKIWMMRKGEGKANAHLIAAAPELYDALKGMTDRYAPSYHDCIDDGLPECEICAARAALAKARGES